MRISDVSPRPESKSLDSSDLLVATGETESQQCARPDKPTSRRALFAAGVAALAVAAAPRRAGAQGIGIPRPRKHDRISIVPDETPVAPKNGRATPRACCGASHTE